MSSGKTLDKNFLTLELGELKDEQPNIEENYSARSESIPDGIHAFRFN